MATGSLGQGLSVAAGMAYTGKHFDNARSDTITTCMKTQLIWVAIAEGLQPHKECMIE